MEEVVEVEPVEALKTASHKCWNNHDGLL